MHCFPAFGDNCMQDPDGVRFVNLTFNREQKSHGARKLGVIWKAPIDLTMS